MKLVDTIKSFFSRPLHYLTSRNHNILFIQAYPKKGIVVVSYKGKAAKGLFDDKTLHNMMKGVRFEHNAQEFLTAVGKLLDQLINN